QPARRPCACRGSGPDRRADAARVVRVRSDPSARHLLGAVPARDPGRGAPGAAGRRACADVGRHPARRQDDHRLGRWTPRNAGRGGRSACARDSDLMAIAPATGTARAASPTVTLTVACLATAMLMLDVAVVNTAIAQIGIDLHEGPGSLKWIVDAYALGLAAAVLTVGALADRFGRRNAFILGIVLFTASSAACASAQDITTLIVSRAVQG